MILANAVLQYSYMSGYLTEKRPGQALRSDRPYEFPERTHVPQLGIKSISLLQFRQGFSNSGKINLPRIALI